MLKWKTLLSALLVSFLFIVNQAVNAKSVKIVQGDTFGSDPYRLVVKHQDYILTSGTSQVGTNRASSTIDILLHADGSIKLVNQYSNYDYPLMVDDSYMVDVIDMKANEDYVFILAYTSVGDRVISATVDEEGHLNFISEAEIDLVSAEAQLLVDNESDHIYVTSPMSGVQIQHLSLASDGKLSRISTKFVGELSPTRPSYDIYLRSSFTNNKIISVSNQVDNPAKIYLIEPDENGLPIKSKQLTFSNAKPSYGAIHFDGKYVYMSFRGWGFHIAELIDDELIEVYVHEEEVVSYKSFAIQENKLYATDIYGTIDIFDISDKNNISLVDIVKTHGGFNHDAFWDSGKLYVAGGSGGLGVYEESDEGKLSMVSQFSQSGEVTDFSYTKNRLVTTALDTTLNFWTKENNQWRYHQQFVRDGSDITALYADEEKILLVGYGNLELHQWSDIENGLDNALQLGTVHWSARDSQIVPLANGYYVKAYKRLSFFTSIYEAGSSFDVPYDTGYSGYVQRPHVTDSRLYLPVNSNPKKVLIYNTEDINNVRLVSEIDKDSSYSFQGNVVSSGNYLFLPDLMGESNSPAISVHDVSDEQDIKKITSVVLSGEVRSLHVYGEYLIASGEGTHLIDISEPSSPKVLDYNKKILSNGISTMVNGEFISVAKNTSGHIVTAYINVGPEHDDLNLITEEDSTLTATLLGIDPENDAVSYSVKDQATNGIASVTDSGEIQYIPNQHFNGEDEITMSINDIHGNTASFKVSVLVEPVNDAPVSSEEEISISVEQGASKVISSTFTDVDDSELSFTVSTEASKGSVEVTNSGEITYTASSDSAGNDSFSITASDSAGLEATLVVNISITEKQQTQPVNNGAKSGSASKGGSLYILVFFMLFVSLIRYTRKEKV
ncbi:Ig-like domain-containing protein [Flocculibacter collagenilyticus]|uniref:Ig-like domain-containing protein n=1 Tax=Flocculibacter collagenilyticus TaxID=2744479 RepID=UPI0018F63F92|nr:Ig-like domain-containing protein [Flocculibacter collagenilyticus]